ncbi:MAG: hypothetical protein JWM09_1409 [Francisellaceae bacterium]|nr:hypothetical protein [Francisellaceae bacterium]
MLPSHVNHCSINEVEQKELNFFLKVFTLFIKELDDFLKKSNSKTQKNESHSQENFVNLIGYCKMALTYKKKMGHNKDLTFEKVMNFLKQVLHNHELKLSSNLLSFQDNKIVHELLYEDEIENTTPSSVNFPVQFSSSSSSSSLKTYKEVQKTNDLKINLLKEHKNFGMEEHKNNETEEHKEQEFKQNHLFNESLFLENPLKYLSNAFAKKYSIHLGLEIIATNNIFSLNFNNFDLENIIKFTSLFPENALLNCEEYSSNHDDCVYNSTLVLSNSLMILLMNALDIPEPYHKYIMINLDEQLAIHGKKYDIKVSHIKSDITFEQSIKDIEQNLKTKLDIQIENSFSVFIEPNSRSPLTKWLFIFLKSEALEKFTIFFDKFGAENLLLMEEIELKSTIYKNLIPCARGFHFIYYISVDAMTEFLHFINFKTKFSIEQNPSIANLSSFDNHLSLIEKMKNYLMDWKSINSLYDPKKYSTLSHLLEFIKLTLKYLYETEQIEMSEEMNRQQLQLNNSFCLITKNDIKALHAINESIKEIDKQYPEFNVNNSIKIENPDDKFIKLLMNKNILYIIIKDFMRDEGVSSDHLQTFQKFFNEALACVYKINPASPIMYSYETNTLEIQAEYKLNNSKKEGHSNSPSGKP